ncbi:MAG: VOC family protein [Ferruginibacter sp.]
MSSINSYLTFNGDCREAMEFYQKCLGGQLFFQTVGESPLSEKMPKKMKDCILHSTLTNGSLLLMGSDMVGENGLVRGNAVSLALDCVSEKEIRSCYKKLSAGGQATHPLKGTFWGALFGGLTDKYGNSWTLNYSRKQNESGLSF